MGKKKSTVTETEGSGKIKATWPDEIVATFCDIAVKEVAKGNRPGTHFDKKGWSNVVEAFKKLTGRDYDKSQLKNKWDSLKNDWKLWSSLMHKETGIGWDPAKKTVDAPPEWWQSKIQENPEYRKFRDVGISPDMMDIYDNMFKGTSALGHCVMIPSASIDVEEVVEDYELNVISADDEEDPELGNEERGKKRANEDRPAKANKDKGVVRGPKGKKGKVGGAVKLYKQIDRLVEVVESRSTATSVHTSSQGTSIQEVMRVVASLPGAETGTKLWWFSTELFCSQEKREMFSVMIDPDLKLQFLILNQKKVDSTL